MQLRDFVKAAKTEIKIGDWKVGKVPHADFPLRKKGALRLGTSFEWCVIKFEALGFDCRVLVVLNPSKSIFEATLGVEADEGLRVICSYECHPDVTTGWHCHATCDDLSTVPVEIRRGPWVRRIPGARKTHRRRDLGVESRTEAVRAAQHCYRIFGKGSLI